MSTDNCPKCNKLECDCFNDVLDDISSGKDVPYEPQMKERLVEVLRQKGVAKYVRNEGFDSSEEQMETLATAILAEIIKQLPKEKWEEKDKLQDRTLESYDGKIFKCKVKVHVCSIENRGYNQAIKDMRGKLK